MRTSVLWCIMLIITLKFWSYRTTNFHFRFVGLCDQGSNLLFKFVIGGLLESQRVSVLSALYHERVIYSMMVFLWQIYPAPKCEWLSRVSAGVERNHGNKKLPSTEVKASTIYLSKTKTHVIWPHYIRYGELRVALWDRHPRSGCMDGCVVYDLLLHIARNVKTLWRH